MSQIDIHESLHGGVERSDADEKSFGVSDFFNALSFVFRFKTSLILGALTFAALSVGISAVTSGGISMFVTVIFWMILATTLSFGILANTVGSFQTGSRNGSFKPDMKRPSLRLWQDAVQPFLLSVGVYISSFGPFAVLLGIGFYLVFSAVNTQMSAFQSEIEKIPGTHYYVGRDTVQQSGVVRSVLAAKSSNGAPDDAGNAGKISESADPKGIEREARRREAEEVQAAPLDSVVAESPAARDTENRETLQSLLALAPPLVVIGGLALIWGLFYFPAACAVAVNTRSFAATVDPRTGANTIRSLGLTYVKLLFMGLLLIVAAAFVFIVSSTIFGGLDTPVIGDLPAKAVHGIVTFYITVIFSTLLGYAIIRTPYHRRLAR